MICVTVICVTMICVTVICVLLISVVRRSQPPLTTSSPPLRDKDLWSDGEVAKDKILASRWMRQFAHTW